MNASEPNAFTINGLVTPGEAISAGHSAAAPMNSRRAKTLHDVYPGLLDLAALGEQGHLLRWGAVGDFEIAAALAGAPALGLSGDKSAPENHRDDGDAVPGSGATQ